METADSRFPETRKSQFQWARFSLPARGEAKTQTQRRLRSPRPRNRDGSASLQKGERYEIHLVPSHAVPVPAGRLQGKVSQRVGRYPARLVRSETRASALQRLPRSTRVRRLDGLRRTRRQRASSERRWADAIAEYHGGGADPAHSQRKPGGARQLDRAL